MLNGGVGDYCAPPTSPARAIWIECMLVASALFFPLCYSNDSGILWRTFIRFKRPSKPKSIWNRQALSLFQHKVEWPFLLEWLPPEPMHKEPHFLEIHRTVSNNHGISGTIYGYLFSVGFGRKKGIQIWLYMGQFNRLVASFWSC